MRTENVSRGWPWRLARAVAHAVLFGLLISHGDVDGADRFAFPLPVLAADLAWPAIAMRQVSAPARVVTPGGAAVASLLAVAHAALPFVQGAPWEPVAGLVRFVAGRVRFAAALGWIVAFAAVVALAGMTASTAGATFD